MPFTLCASGAIVIKAGANVNSTAAASAALLEQYSNEAEALINFYTRYDWVKNYSVVQDKATSYALYEAASNLAAINLIAYDMSGYPGKGYAEDMMNILNYKAFRILDLLKEDKNRQFTIDGATGVS